MRALVKTTAGPGLELIDVPEPRCGPSDVKVRVLRAGLCGTDLHIHDWDDWAASTVKAPLIVGHEFFGEVVEVGEDVPADMVAVGDRISGEGHLVCGHCRNCRAGRKHLCINTIGIGVNRDGAFADLIVLPASNAYVQPAGFDTDLGAIFDPFGNATHTALQWPMVGEDVLITGAGPIGIMAVAIARFAGARHIVVTDVNDYRLELAARLGASRIVNVSREPLDAAMQSLGMAEGFDVGMEMSGNPAAFRDMLRTMHHGGSIAMLGIMPEGTGIDWDQVIFKGLVLKGVYGREMFETWYKMASMLQSGLDVRPVITHRLPIADYRDGFEIMGSGRSGKVILDWSGN